MSVKSAPPRVVVALIEDEPLLRVPLAKALAQRGVRVVSAASGLEGLGLLEDPDIDVAVIDLRLSGRIDGLTLAKEARRQHPGLHIIFVSARPPGDEAAALGGYLQKPFTPEDLLHAIREHVPAAGAAHPAWSAD
jgi:DNA-binding response OmpR family regulator